MQKVESKFELKNSTTVSKGTAVEMNFVWKTAISVCITLLILQFCQSWLPALLKRSLLDNSFNVLSLACLLVAFRHYRQNAPSMKTCQSRTGLILLFISSLATAFGIYFYFSRIAWLGTLAMVGSLVGALNGRRQFNYWRPLLFFSITLIPAGFDGLFSHLSVLLKNASMAISTSLAGLFMNLKIDGSVITVDGASVEVTAACSGLAILTSLIFIVLLWQLYRPMKFTGLLLLLLAACFVGVITNGIRLFLTLLTVHYHSLAMGLSIHSNIEILLLPLAMLSLFLIARRSGRYDATV